MSAQNEESTLHCRARLPRTRLPRNDGEQLVPGSHEPMLRSEALPVTHRLHLLGACCDIVNLNAFHACTAASLLRLASSKPLAAVMHAVHITRGGRQKDTGRVRIQPFAQQLAKIAGSLLTTNCSQAGSCAWEKAFLAGEYVAKAPHARLERRLHSFHHLGAPAGFARPVH